MRRTKVCVCHFIITILMVLKPSEVEGDSVPLSAQLDASFPKISNGCKSGKGTKKGKKGCDDSVLSGGVYWQSFAPSVTPGASTSFVPSASPAWTFISGDETGHVTHSPSTDPTSGFLTTTGSPVVISDNAPTTESQGSPHSEAAVPMPISEASEPSPTPAGAGPPGPTLDSGAGTPPPSSSTDLGTPGASEPSLTKPDILTEQAGSGDDTGLLSACAIHPPETRANTEIRVLAFEYAMLVVLETNVPYIETIAHEVEVRLHEVLAKELLQCMFSADASVQRMGGEQEEFEFLSISSLPKDFITSDDCADDEKKDNTDCVVIAGIFTVEFLKGGSFDDILSGLTRLMKELMPPNVRRELAENLSVANIDPNLKGLVFRSFITPFNDTAGMNPIIHGSEQPDDDGSSKSRRAITGTVIVGTAAAVAIVVGFLAMQQIHRRRSLGGDGETTTIGIKPRPSNSSSSEIPVLPIFHDPHVKEMYDMSVFTTARLEPFGCGGSENGNSDCEKTHNSLSCEMANCPICLGNASKSHDSDEQYDHFDEDSVLSRKMWFSLDTISI